MDTGNVRGTGPRGAGSSLCPTCRGGKRQVPGVRLAGKQGTSQEQRGPRVEMPGLSGAWLLILALVPTCQVALNKSLPLPWDLFPPTVSEGRG